MLQLRVCTCTNVATRGNLKPPAPSRERERGEGGNIYTSDCADSTGGERNDTNILHQGLLINRPADDLGPDPGPGGNVCPSCSLPRGYSGSHCRVSDAYGVGYANTNFSGRMNLLDSKGISDLKG